jgi:hypothetical protein
VEDGTGRTRDVGPGVRAAGAGGREGKGGVGREGKHQASVYLGFEDAQDESDL